MGIMVEMKCEGIVVISTGYASCSRETSVAKLEHSHSMDRMLRSHYYCDLCAAAWRGADYGGAKRTATADEQAVHDLVARGSILAHPYSDYELQFLPGLDASGRDIASAKGFLFEDCVECGKPFSYDLVFEGDKVESTRCMYCSGPTPSCKIRLKSMRGVNPGSRQVVYGLRYTGPGDRPIGWTLDSSSSLKDLGGRYATHSREEAEQDAQRFGANGNHYIVDEMRDFKFADSSLWSTRNPGFDASQGVA